MFKPAQLLSLAILFTAAVSPATAELQLPGVFSDGAVLQRGMPVPIWGIAKPGERIRVAFAGQRKETTASKSGRWRINLEPIPASSEARELTITGEGKTLTIRNVLVGEVWLCSGQSNMAMKVSLARDYEQEKAASNLPLIRVHTVLNNPARKPVDDSPGSWTEAHPDAIGRFSATAFFFGRELHRKLGVPIGLIVAARGGSDIATWTSRAAQDSEPALKSLLASWDKQTKAYTPELAARENAVYEREYPRWRDAVREAAKAGHERPRKPDAARKPIHPADHHHCPAALFNGMIHPLIPYAVRGVIWYQGETNAFTEETSTLYEKQLRLLITDWRKRWDQGDLPFAWVQLPFSPAHQLAWARIRESMRRALSLPNTGMAVTLDLRDAPPLHPKNKQDFAHRLALWARAEVYGENIAWSGPLFAGARAGEKGVLLRFNHAQGLKAIQDPLVGFEYRAGTNDWKPITARIRNDRVVIMNPPGEAPNAIRYAWANDPKHNLVNAAGLPASPFIAEFAAVKSISAPKKVKKKKPAPTDLVKSPLVRADISMFPGRTTRLDIFLLMGQSNMKGRGKMPANPRMNPQIVMMHKPSDGYYLARHPLHLTGDPKDFSGTDNAGVGPGLAFAQAFAAARPESRVLLVPCAVGGTQIAKWQKGQRLYEEAVRKAKLAMKQGPQGKVSIAGALWLQGESDSQTPEKRAIYPERLKQMITDLRADLNVDNLPFIACTIGELKPGSIDDRKAINAILLDLPNRVPHTACIDSRKFAKSIGDNVHFDTETQNEHGRLFAEALLSMQPND